MKENRLQLLASKIYQLKVDLRDFCYILIELNRLTKIEFFVDEFQRLNEKIDNLGSDMQWMKHALIEWTKAIEQDEQTNALIEKYCKDDVKRADVRF